MFLLGLVLGFFAGVGACVVLGMALTPQRPFPKDDLEQMWKRPGRGRAAGRER